MLGSVNFFQLFRFATTKDRCLMGLGILAALATGPCLSLLLILFGDLIYFVVFTSNGIKNITSKPLHLNESLLYQRYARFLSFLFPYDYNWAVTFCFLYQQ